MIPRIVAINIYSKKSRAVFSVSKAELKADYGIIGDDYAGQKTRQVSLLAKEAINDFNKAHNSKIAMGDSGENIITEGIHLHELEKGSRLKISDIILETTKKGGKCSKPCFIGKNFGDRIMSKEGAFAKVIEGGQIKVGDKIRLLT